MINQHKTADIVELIVDSLIDEMVNVDVIEEIA